MNKKVWISIILLLVIANCWYYNPFQLFFLNDDLLHIPLTANGVLFQQRSIRPIHELLVRMDLFFWGKKAFGYHITALLLHFIVAFELFFLAKLFFEKIFDLGKEKSQQLAFLSVAIFLCYPQHAESLAWILGRTPTLATVFFLPVIMLFLQEKKSVWLLIVSFILYLLSLFTYEQSILFPLVLLMLAFVERDEANKKSKLIFTGLIGVATLVYVIARKLITTEVVGAYEAGNFTGFQIGTLVNNFYRLFVRLLLNPINQPKIFFIISLCFLLLLIVFVWKKRTELIRVPVLVLIVSIILLLLPVISLGISVRSWESGRYLYLPSVFLSILLAFILFQIQSFQLKITVIVACFIYWTFGKIDSSKDFKQASVYSQIVQTEILHQYLQNPKQEILIDTLHITIQRLPVYRMGLRTGMAWLNPQIDTNKLKTGYIFDEFVENP